MPSSPFNMVRTRLGRAVDWRVDTAIQRTTATTMEQVEARLQTFDTDLHNTLELLEATRRGLRVEDHAMIDRRLGLVDERFNAVEDALFRNRRTDDLLDELTDSVEAMRDDLGALREIVRAQSVQAADQQRADVALLEQLDRRVRMLEQSAQGSAHDDVTDEPATPRG